MITIFCGENSFELSRALEKTIADFDGAVERVDGSTLEIKNLPDLLMGATLFADKRLVIIKNLSENSTVWSAFSDWIGRVSDDIQLVIVEPKPDKRTKTYKELKKVADVREFLPWSERDSLKAEQWLVDEAKQLGFELDKKSAHHIVARVGFDQWQLYHALRKLAVVDEVSIAVIDDIIEAQPLENVFYLFEAALQGDARKVKTMVTTLSLQEDPYKLFGLLSGQAFQMAALAIADQPSAEVAKDLGVHPFALGKLEKYAKKGSRPGARRIIRAFADADAAMKTSAADPWILIERALVEVASSSEIR